jgi:SNF2 family DNA or RNA helicase
MSLFNNLFKSKDSKADAPVEPIAGRLYFDQTGINYEFAANTEDIASGALQTNDALTDQVRRLSQLATEGIARQAGSHFSISWDSVYQILSDEEFASYVLPLGIPTFTTAVPKLKNSGALLDPAFSILLEEWVDPTGVPLALQPKLEGKVLRTRSGVHLLKPLVGDLVDELQAFHAVPAEARDQKFKELRYGKIRRLAFDTSSPVSDYVSKTIVITPEKLKLVIEKRGEANDRVIELIPSFEEAPSDWLSTFDRFPISDAYEVPDGMSVTRIVLTPEVKAVLSEVKKMPARRVTGARAEAFVRNPFSVLGEEAAKVLDPEEVELQLTKAGISFAQFTPHAEFGEFGEVTRVGILISDLSKPGESSVCYWFDSANELARFIHKATASNASDAQSFAWMRYDLDIIGDTLDQIDQLSIWLDAWASPELWTASEVLDLSHYSDRIESIGFEKPFIVPVISKKNNENGWFDENVTTGLATVDDKTGELTIVSFPFKNILSLQETVEDAIRNKKTHVQLLGLKQPVPLHDAQLALKDLKAAREDLKEKKFTPPSKNIKKPISQKKRLVIKRNLEDINYTEKRAETLNMAEGAKPVIPSAMLASVQLKAHQHIGLAWLQHLWKLSPQHCRGTVLADDMGLGKTLQLLAFMVSAFEADPDLPPALVVAPVALLENWQNELERFFQPGTLPTLLLYGSTLKLLRVAKNEIDQTLRNEGVTRLLKKGWIGNNKLVLTTYETMRDLEFALASQPWSIMVCDEAQKIKTPAAMVTRSAKKQKVRFRIACTGTPVENSLADLWCLFDFVQPGMLGALNFFSRTYRQPIEAKTLEQKRKVEELRELIRPQILHRKKSEVATDLPSPKEDQGCKRLAMSEYQHHYYEQALANLQEQKQVNPSAQLLALQAIRKICSDPHGHAEANTNTVPIDRLLNESPKMGWLINLLKGLGADPDGSHKVIIFCEFRALQITLQRVIAATFGFAPSIVNGDTSADPSANENRQQLIDKFQNKIGFNVIILSPLAVGFGVNIQAANHVVHFTRTWNPAKEDQATARAYRIGQTRTVQVYYPGVVSPKFPSFDVRLDALLSKKRALAADLLNGCSDLKIDDFSELL